MDVIATFVPVPGRDPRADLASPPAGASLVELRADLLPPDPGLDALLAASPLPVVLTLRSRAEGGSGPDSAAERRAFFERALALPFALLDLEAGRDLELVGSLVPRERVVLSEHLADVPADLEARARDLLAAGTRLAKLVPTARSLDDVLAVLSLALAFDRGARAERRAVVFATGEAGRSTRLLGPLLGAPVAYSAWSDERAAAPGQMTAEELRAILGHLQGRPRRLFAVLGRSVGGSLSPRLHAAAYRALALPNLLVPLEVADGEELGRLLAPLGAGALDRLGLPVGGFAVTMPWKERAAQSCTVLAPRAGRARSANTVLPRPGSVLGDCTDIDAVTRVLAEESVAPGSRALVLGSGATARAAVVALDLAGMQVAVAGRDRDVAQGIARELGVVAAEPAEAATFAVAVNATPAGADGGDETLLANLALPAGALVLDFPYGAAPTTLERLAAERGWRFVGGRELLLLQGLAQFAAMNAAAPPVRAMAASLGLAETGA